MKIRESILQKISDSQGCKARIRLALSISAPTMTRYIQRNDENLTKEAALSVIREYFNLSNDDILQTEDSNTLNHTK